MSSILVLWAYFIFLLHLRIFEVTATVINLIFYVFKESMVFCFLFSIVCLAFGNSFYILSILEHPDDSSEKLTGPNIFTAFIYAYETSLGGFHTDQINEIKNYQIIFYIFFIVQTFISMIVILNLLISILGDIFGRVMETQKQERYKAKCNLITENEFIFPRDEMFKDVKYIIRIEPEKRAKKDKGRN